MARFDITGASCLRGVVQELKISCLVLQVCRCTAFHGFLLRGKVFKAAQRFRKRRKPAARPRKRRPIKVVCEVLAVLWHGRHVHRSDLAWERLQPRVAEHAPAGFLVVHHRHADDRSLSAIVLRHTSVFVCRFNLNLKPGTTEGISAKPLRPIAPSTRQKESS